jgi:hypothetical protein
MVRRAVFAVLFLVPRRVLDLASALVLGMEAMFMRFRLRHVLQSDSK